MFTVMTWNVENLFAPHPADRAAYDAKVAELAEVIRTAAPDLLAVQEIGDEQSFAALRDALGWTGVLATHVEVSHPIRVGWLAPVGLTDVEEVVDLPAPPAGVVYGEVIECATIEGTALSRLTVEAGEPAPVQAEHAL